MSLAIRDQLTPQLLKCAKGIADRKPILEAMALQLVSLTKRAFSDAALRAAPWKPRKDKKPHNLLRKSGALWQSIRVGEVTNDHSTVATDRVYGAHQQFGSKAGSKHNLPPRPYFPFATPSSEMTQTAQEKVQRVAVAKIKAILGATGT